jgi:hypothetical protein
VSNRALASSAFNTPFSKTHLLYPSTVALPQGYPLTWSFPCTIPSPGSLWDILTLGLSSPSCFSKFQSIKDRKNPYCHILLNTGFSLQVCGNCFPTRWGHQLDFL